MFKSFKAKQLIFIALMAVLLFVINLVFGSILIAATGIPMANAIFSGITFGIFVLLMVRTLPKFWTFTLFFLIYSILEIPTPLGGAPGFWPKIPINVLVGLAADSFLLSTKYKKWSYFVGFYVLATVNTLAFIFFMKMFNVPGVEKLAAILWWLIPVYWVLGTIGILIGEAIYNKLKNNKTYLQIKD